MLVNNTDGSTFSRPNTYHVMLFSDSRQLIKVPRIYYILLKNNYFNLQPMKRHLPLVQHKIELMKSKLTLIVPLELFNRLNVTWIVQGLHSILLKINCKGLGIMSTIYAAHEAVDQVSA